MQKRPYQPNSFSTRGAATPVISPDTPIARPEKVPAFSLMRNAREVPTP